MDRVRAAGGGIRSAPHRHRSDQSKPDFLQRQHSGSGGFHRSAAVVAAVVVAPSPRRLRGEGCSTVSTKRMGEGLTLPPHPAELVKTQAMPSPRKRGEGAITDAAQSYISTGSPT